MQWIQDFSKGGANIGVQDRGGCGRWEDAGEGRVWERGGCRIGEGAAEGRVVGGRGEERVWERGGGGGEGVGEGVCLLPQGSFCH